ncbi:Exoglucanase [Dactylella cylindrospora]|nr:Exoglucanase [Dactylella cylindrospora]
MPAFSKIALFSSLISYVAAQQAGSVTAETHPTLTSQTCTRSGGCTTKNTKIVVDANWRWLRNNAPNQYNNCYTGNTFDSTLCGTNDACAANCALEGADYSGTYGITTSGNALTLKFVTRSSTTNVGSRVYLMDDDTNYTMFKPNNMEFTFDVDVSNMPCGVNAALYFIEMEKDGGMASHPGNKAGAKYGTGYCDAQCPHDLKFIAGTGNAEGWTPSSTDSNAGFGRYGACCAEMDIWEANSISNAYTPHVADNPGLYRCGDAVTCGDGSNRYAGVTDKDGCDFNPFRQGNKEFYGPGKTVNTNSKFTVVTQFITDDMTPTGTLVEIRRIWVQNGQVILQSKNTWPGIGDHNSVNDDFCVKQKQVFGDNPYFNQHGGVAKMGESLARGHVLALSIWADHAAHLLWLNSPYPVDADPTLPGIARGTCSTTSGDPNELIQSVPNSSVTYSNIKFGELCSTFSDPQGIAPCGPYSPPSGSTSTTTSRTTTTSSRTTTTSSRTTTTSSRTTTTSSRTTTTSSRTTTASRTTTTTTRTTTANSAQQTKWGQCGGIGFTGPTSCVSGTTCTVLNPYYSQCL